MIRSFRFAENPYLKLVFQHILIDLIDRFAFFVHVLDQNVVAGQTIQYFRPTGNRHLRIDIEPFLSKKALFLYEVVVCLLKSTQLSGERLDDFHPGLERDRAFYVAV